MNAADTALLRELLEVPRVAALGVLVEGAPYVGLLPFAVAADRQALLVHASRLARHTRGLLAGAPFSALVHAPEAPGADPLQLPRVTFLGSVAPLAGDDEAEARARYLARFPGAEQTFTLPDFALYALRIREGRLVAGFARARDVSPGDLLGL
ncbi:MAG TPA: pyridoxamine 5'-phosphate oxidase [Myxococcales bacterium]